MTPTELSQLTNIEQRNALLAIALGYDVTKMFLSIPNRTLLVVDWKPEQNHALMWQLVCELRERLLNTEADFLRLMWVAIESQSMLITTYIAADPKGLVAQWRKNND